ncbi:MAG: ATP synthase F1 subunit epsilon [Limisphaerales bacterium]
MAATLKLEIITPEAKVYSDDVEMVTLTGIDGEMGIYPTHMPLMTQLVAGEIMARKDGQNIFLAVGDGFVQVTGERVAVLTDMAIKAMILTKRRPRKPVNAPRPVLRKRLPTPKPLPPVPRSRILWRSLKSNAAPTGN